MEARSGSDLSNRSSNLGIGAERLIDQSRMMLVPGRSFHQASRSSYQFYEVKRMIRGSGVEMTLTYSQTLNM